MDFEVALIDEMMESLRWRSLNKVIKFENKYHLKKNHGYLSNLVDSLATFLSR